MQVERLSRKFSAAILMIALCGSSTIAAASPLANAAPAGVSPAIALSMLGSDASRAALCGTAAVTAAAAAAAGTAAQAGPVQGCVLPAVDQVAAVPVPVAEPMPVAVATRGPSLVGPLLLGLAGLVAVFGLLQLLKNDDGKARPISPQ